jgi:predicted nucleic acid-binding protein
MNYLLDTCVLSELLKRRPERSVTEWISSVPEYNLFLSILTLGEIYKGIAKLYPGEKKEKLVEWVEHDLKTRFEGRVVNLNEEILKIWGDITGEAERHGKKWPVLDSLLASTALANQMVFVTRNTHHVEELGVKVLDPWEA